MADTFAGSQQYTRKRRLTSEPMNEKQEHEIGLGSLLAPIGRPLTKLAEAVSEWITVGVSSKKKILGSRANQNSRLDELATDLKILEVLDNPTLSDDDRDDLYRKHIGVRAAHAGGRVAVRRQANRERIVVNAAASLPPRVSSKPVDEDWIHFFFNSCEDVADETMQIIWGKLLAGEVAEPGSFSRRTVNEFRKFNRDDALILQKWCARSCEVLEGIGERAMALGSKAPWSGVFFPGVDPEENYNLDLGFEMFKIPYGEYEAAMEIGIVSTHEGGKISFPADELPVRISLGAGERRTYLLEPSNSALLNGEWVLTNLMLTRVGRELRQLVNVPLNRKHIARFEKALAKSGVSCTVIS